MPAEEKSVSSGFASTPATLNSVPSVGPTPRKRTFLLPVPSITKPAIRMLAPEPTLALAERSTILPPPCDGGSGAATVSVAAVLVTDDPPLVTETV